MAAAAGFRLRRRRKAASAGREGLLGSQIRSYVLHPYQLVKDHRTKEQAGDVNRILDGDLDAFIKAYLMKRASGTLATDTGEDVE
jgi:peptide chain release factor 2